MVAPDGSISGPSEQVFADSATGTAGVRFAAPGTYLMVAIAAGVEVEVEISDELAVGSGDDVEVSVEPAVVERRPELDRARRGRRRPGPCAG